MDIKEKFKSFVKMPANLTTNLATNLNTSESNFKSQASSINNTINNLFNHNQDKINLNNLNKNSLSIEDIKYIQEKYLPIVTQYTKQKESRETQINPYLTNPILEKEIINSVEDVYYSDLIDDDKLIDNNELIDNFNENSIENSIENELINDEQLEDNKFDPFEHILNKLKNTMDLGFILEEKKKLNKQLMVVTKRVSDLIKQNQDAYNKELESVIELQNILNDTIITCSYGRTKLELAKKNLTFPNLNIISTYKRREIMKLLLKELYTIKTLLQTELTLNDLIVEEEDYANSIKLCLECIKIISKLNHYKCLYDLGTKLNCTIEMIEDRLSERLAKLCIHFNSEQFIKIKDTFYLLDKTQFFYDQLLIQFSNTIKEKTFNIVNSYVELCSSNLNDSSFNNKLNNQNLKINLNEKEQNFENVCSLLSSDCFISCLIDFNKSMFNIMINYKKLLNLHNFNDDNDNNDEINQTNELDCNLTLIKQKLKYGLSKIWQDIEIKLSILIKNNNLSIYSFDDFITMINIVRLMIDIGLQFSNTEHCELLNETLKKSTSEYFYLYHKSKMEEIKVFLETELWELIPMKTEFSIEQLHEFNFLKENRINNFNKINLDNYFIELIDTKNNLDTPFDNFIKYRKEDNNLKKEFKEDNLESENLIANDNCITKLPIITNSSLNILRIVGKYMQIMYIFNQISFDILLCIFHLFDYYLYGVYTFFGCNELDKQFIQTFINPSQNLLTLFKRIESRLIINKTSNSNNDKCIRIYPPKLSNMVNLNDKEYLYGLLERAIGVESMVFIGDQLKKIHEPLLTLINEEGKVWLDQFYKQTINVSIELREPVYMYVASKYLQHEQIIQSMEKINWEVKEIMSQHNLYVDQLISDLQLFHLKEIDLIQFCCKLNKESDQLLWTQILKLVNYVFVEGFSTVKKCTPEGRALMSLDYTTYLCKIENLVSIKPIPNRDLVDEYIKAYYYTEEQLETLIKSNRDYTVKQLKSLVNCILSDNKKGRQRLLALIDNEYVK